MSLESLRQKWCANDRAGVKSTLQFCAVNEPLKTIEQTQDDHFDRWFNGEQDKGPSSVDYASLERDLNLLDGELDREYTRRMAPTSQYLLRKGFLQKEQGVYELLLLVQDLGLTVVDKKGVKTPFNPITSNMSSPYAAVRAKAYLDSFTNIDANFRAILQRNDAITRQYINFGDLQRFGFQVIPQEYQDIFILSNPNQVRDEYMRLLKDFANSKRNNVNSSLFNKNKYGFENTLQCGTKRCTLQQHADRIVRNKERLSRLATQNTEDEFDFIDDQLSSPHYEDNYFA